MRKRPNVIIITTDQHRYDALGCSGNKAICTPNIDRLAMEGVMFSRAYVTNPVCTPSRASLLTGRYIRSHRCWNVGMSVPRDEVTLSGLLSENGYETGIIGKAHFEPIRGDGKEYVESKWEDRDENHSFFRTWSGPYYGFNYCRLCSGHGYYAAHGHYGQWLKDTHPEEVEKLWRMHSPQERMPAHETFQSSIPEELHNSSWIGNESVKYIRRNREKKFFLWVSFPDPHHPFSPPVSYCNMYKGKELPLPVRREDEKQFYFFENEEYEKYLKWKENGNYDGQESIDQGGLAAILSHYYGMISLVDKNVGKILACLDEEGLTDNTIVIFTSDHGEYLGAHNLFLKAPFHFEDMIRVPYIWRWPCRIPAGRRENRIVSLVDATPTILEAAEIPKPYGMQGESLLGMMEEGTPIHRDYALVESREFPGGFSPSRNFSAKTLVTQDYKLNYYKGRSYGEMYNLEKDPWEMDNLWENPAYALTRSHMIQKLLDALIETEDPLQEKIAEC